MNRKIGVYEKVDSKELSNVYAELGIERREAPNFIGRDYNVHQGGHTNCGAQMASMRNLNRPLAIRVRPNANGNKCGYVLGISLAGDLMNVQYFGEGDVDAVQRVFDKHLQRCEQKEIAGSFR